jgi:hypothetical protein
MDDLITDLIHKIFDLLSLTDQANFAILSKRLNKIVQLKLNEQWTILVRKFRTIIENHIISVTDEMIWNPHLRIDMSRNFPEKHIFNCISGICVSQNLNQLKLLFDVILYYKENENLIEFFFKIVISYQHIDIILQILEKHDYNKTFFKVLTYVVGGIISHDQLNNLIDSGDLNQKQLELLTFWCCQRHSIGIRKFNYNIYKKIYKTGVKICPNCKMSMLKHQFY